MRTAIVYESMYGNTRRIAEAIAGGLHAGGVDAELVSGADVASVGPVDVLIVGAPTHVHRLPTARTRRAAVAATQKPGSPLQLEPGAADSALREWLTALPRLDATEAAVFDTRMPGPPILTGRAGKTIAKHLRHRGAQLIDDPRSFVVEKTNELRAGELERAHEWGALLAAQLRAPAPRMPASRG